MSTLLEGVLFVGGAIVFAVVGVLAGRRFTGGRIDAGG